MPTCIYCGCQGPFNREHAVPQAFGEFDGLRELLETVCATCNRAVGSGPEEQFARSSVNAVFRQLLGVEGNPRNLKKNHFDYGSSGGRAIDLEIVHPVFGCTLLLEILIQNGTTMFRPLDQVIVEHEGRSFPIRLNKHTNTLEKLKVAIKKVRDENSIAVPYKLYFMTSSNAARELVLQLLAEPGGETEFFSRDLPPTRVYQADMRIGVTTQIFRAIAKAAFHYVLATFSRLRGDELAFAAIRNFIRHGGQNTFVEIAHPGDQTIPFESVNRSETHHQFTTVWANGSLQVVTEFFVSPCYCPAIFRTFCGEGVPYFAGQGRYRHVFEYYPEGPRGRFQGHMRLLHRSGTAIEDTDSLTGTPQLWRPDND